MNFFNLSQKVPFVSFVLFSLCMLLSLGGCGTSVRSVHEGVHIRQDDIQKKITPGLTVPESLHDLLFYPIVHPLDDHKEYYVYRYLGQHPRKGLITKRFQCLRVRWRPDGTMHDYYMNTKEQGIVPHGYQTPYPDHFSDAWNILSRNFGRMGSDIQKASS